MSLNIDKEWENFISCSYDGDDISDDDVTEDNINNFVEEKFSTKIKRKIPIIKIYGVTFSNIGCEFVIHVPTEYDYRF